MAKKIVAIGLVAVLVVAIGYGLQSTFRSSQISVKTGSAEIVTHQIRRGDLRVTVIEQGILESSDNHEIKCQVRGTNTVIWVVENGTQVKKGDDLVRLDTLQIEEAINERTKFAYWSQSGAERSAAEVKRALLAVQEYEDGRFVMQELALKKQLALLKSQLQNQENQLVHTRKKAERGFSTKRLVDQLEFARVRALGELELQKDEIKVLNDYTKKMEMKSLEGDLNAAKATHQANLERARLDAERRDKALEEFELCTIRAEKDGLVIYPSAAAWKETPDVAEGATVHKDQVLLLMPDLTKMQVKVGVHESVIDRVKPGYPAVITIPDGELSGEILSVASVARPAGWWTGNLVKYDTIVSLPSRPGLKPGMSAEVEIVLAERRDVVLAPVSAVLQTPSGSFVWVESVKKVVRREVTIGDTNDIFIEVTDGLDAGEIVVLNPIASIREAQDLALESVKSALDTQEEGETETGNTGGSKTKGSAQ